MRSARKIFTDVIFYIVGCSLYSAAVIIFIDPNELSPGGMTGIAMLLQHFFSLPAGVMNILMNIPLIILGFIYFGGKFIASTAVATTILSLLLDALTVFLKPYKTDGILAALFGGIMIGAGLGIVMFRGATTGGADIAAKLINKRFPFVSIGRIVLFLDLAVITATAIVYKNFQSALYSVVALYASSRVIDGLLYGTGKGKLVHIITNKPDEISNRVFESLGRGVTVINATGGYTGNERTVLLCAVRVTEMAELQKIIKHTDDKAFVIISDAGEILGEGFNKNT